MATLTLRLRRSRESGSQLVEMAIVLPLLLILIAGMVDFAFLLHSFQVVTNAAREGARIGALPGYGDVDIQNRVLTYVNSANLGGSPTSCTAASTPLKCTITRPTITPPGGAAFTAVSVSVSYQYTYLFIRPMVSLIGKVFPATKTFTTTSVMRLEVTP